jgi:hypothetical protein
MMGSQLLDPIIRRRRVEISLSEGGEMRSHYEKEES